MGHLQAFLMPDSLDRLGSSTEDLDRTVNSHWGFEPAHANTFPLISLIKWRLSVNPIGPSQTREFESLRRGWWRVLRGWAAIGARLAGGAGKTHVLAGTFLRGVDRARSTDGPPVHA